MYKEPIHNNLRTKKKDWARSKIAKLQSARRHPLENPPPDRRFLKIELFSAVKEIRAGPNLTHPGGISARRGTLCPYVAGLAGLLLHLRRISLFDPGGKGFRSGEPGDL
jgi:hypothetical protein